MKSEKSTILVYAGAGAEPDSIIKFLIDHIKISSHEIVIIGPNDVINDTHIFTEAVVFIMPGGADLPYCAALNGVGNRHIRRYVERGGTYLGICAGAYYGAARIEFHKNRPGAICGKRELAFAAATAIGSIESFGPLYDMTMRSASVPRLIDNESRLFHAYYNGGCYFELDENSEIDVLACYTDLPGNPAAIIETRVGKGRAILSGVHLEVSQQALANKLASLTDGDSYASLVNRLASTDTIRQSLWCDLLSRAGLALL